MKRLLRNILPALMLSIIGIAVTGCGYVDPWDPAPPYGWNDTFYDRDLTGDGCWELWQINGKQIYRDETNYLQFYGNGRGRYFYYDRGYLESERIAYWCQRSVSGTSALQINIQYEYDSPVTMNYWFTDQDTLWMQWRNSYGVQTYVYRWTTRIP